MFKRLDFTLTSNPACTKIVDNLFAKDFAYYDKDGFELCNAEQKFYRAMNYPINNPILNHCCWQESWFELENHDTNLILDHCMFLCRCDYQEAARRQLEEIKSIYPQSDLLLKCKPKWGYDFALDAVINNEVIEVLHIEYDHRNYDIFQSNMFNFEFKIRHTDWFDAAQKIYAAKDQWQHLVGFDQNNWKAKYLLGWSKSEYTEKSI